MSESSHSLHAAAIWAAELFQKRTEAIARGEIVNPEEIPTESRVQWSEVVEAHPWIRRDIVQNRIDFQGLFEEALKKKGLLRVLKGSLSTDDWLRSQRSPKER